MQERSHSSHGSFSAEGKKKPCSHGQAERLLPAQFSWLPPALVWQLHSSPTPIADLCFLFPSTLIPNFPKKHYKRSPNIAQKMCMHYSMLLTTDQPKLGKSRQSFIRTIFHPSQVCWQLQLSLCSLNYTTALCFSFILALIFFLLSHRQGFPQLLLPRRNTTLRPSLLAIRALGLEFRGRNQSCSYSGARKFA